MKKILIILSLIFISFSVMAEPIKVGDTSTVSPPPTIDEKLEEINNNIDETHDRLNTQLLKEQREEERTKANDMVKSLANGNKVVLIIIDKIQTFMDNFEDVMIGSFSRGYGSHKFVKNIIRVLSGIFLIITSLYYVAKMYIDEKFQVSEFPLLFLKFALIMIIWWTVPDIAFFTKKIMWDLAELVVNGKITGMMTYTTAIKGLSVEAMISILFTGIACLLTSFVSITVFGTGTVFTSLGQMFPISFGLAFTGLMATTGATVMYCTWVMEFYIALYVLVLYLPACLFKGFDYKMMSVFKFYFINGLEVFVGGCIILLVCKLYKTDMFMQGNAKSDLLEQAIQFFIKPMLIVILLPLTSKIVNAIATGGGVAENNTGTSDALRRGITGALGGASLMALAQGGGKGIAGGIFNKRQEMKEIELFNSKQTDNKDKLSLANARKRQRENEALRKYADPSK